MSQFVQPLESRRLLSASINLTADEASLGLAVEKIISDAKSARTELVADGKAVASQLKGLDLKNAPLGKALASAINQGKQKIGADVGKIVAAGLKDGHDVVADFLRLQFADDGNTVKITADQTKLAADVTKLYNVEKPFTDKIQADITASETNVENAVQAIVNANKSNTALSTSWATLQSEIQSAQSTLSSDFDQLTSDANQLKADS